MTIFDLSHLKQSLPRPHLLLLLHFFGGNFFFYLKNLNPIPNCHCVKSPDGISNAVGGEKKSLRIDDEECEACERGTKKDK